MLILERRGYYDGKRTGDFVVQKLVDIARSTVHVETHSFVQTVDTDDKVRIIVHCVTHSSSSYNSTHLHHMFLYTTRHCRPVDNVGQQRRSTMSVDNVGRHFLKMTMSTDNIRSCVAGLTALYTTVIDNDKLQLVLHILLIPGHVYVYH